MYRELGTGAANNPSADYETDADSRHHTRQPFACFPDWDLTVLEALVPATETRPKHLLDRQRRPAMRELVPYLHALKQIQAN